MILFERVFSEPLIHPNAAQYRWLQDRSIQENTQKYTQQTIGNND